MVDAVNNIATANAPDATLVRAPAKAAEAAPAAQVPEKEQAAPISPRLVFDPGAGTMVTEFVGKDGKVSAQVPSAAALAYLRAGLNANGQQDAAEPAIAQA